MYSLDINGKLKTTQTFKECDKHVYGKITSSTGFQQQIVLTTTVERMD